MNDLTEGVDDLTGSLPLQVVNLYIEGNSFAKIGEELEISKGNVGKLLREGMASMKNHGGNPGALDEALVVQGENGRLNGSEEEEPTISASRGNPVLDDAWERTLIIEATPIMRKIVLNSKVFLQHEYFRKHFGYEGDIGDLLVEALDFYWREMGFTIRITQDSVV